MESIGVDFGGTRIRAALVDSQGHLRGWQERLTLASRPPQAIVADLAGLIQAVEREAGLGPLPVGVGLPTTVTPGGPVFPCPNLPTLAHGYPLDRELRTRLGRAVTYDNDARCFTRGEWRWGQGQGLPNMLGLTLGTSVGLGVVCDGRLLAGFRGEAGEIWRSPLTQSSGRTLHEVLSGAGLAAAAGAKPGDAADAASRARAGDTRALQAWEAYGDAVGFALQWVCDVLDPQTVVVGGSIAASWDLFSQPVLQRLAGRSLSLVTSSLGDHAAVLGAAALVQSLQEDPSDSV